MAMVVRMDKEKSLSEEMRNCNLIRRSTQMIFVLSKHSKTIKKLADVEEAFQKQKKQGGISDITNTVNVPEEFNFMKFKALMSSARKHLNSEENV